MNTKSLSRTLVMAGALACALAVAVVVRANAPVGRYQNDGSTIHDVKTGLTWQREQMPALMSQADAVAACQDLRLGGSSWRLPTVRELASLVDVTLVSPAIDPVFPGASGTFWSVSPVAGPPGFGWHVNFAYGVVFDSDAGELNHVRCVR